MHGYIPRLIEADILRSLARSPAVAILGPRQCEKSTSLAGGIAYHDLTPFLPAETAEGGK